MNSLAIVAVVFPPLALMAGAFTLYQFGIFYMWLRRLSLQPAEGPFWMYAKPVLKEIVKALTATMGDADRFLAKVQINTVVLTGIMIVLIFSLERIRGALERPRATTHYSRF
ncbi:hypothetical protein CBR_g803 [Chara braunii]|uniref:Uncharacterized protein n=1 Tax=Chara braunii TaxID=69332 RepID=A0A388KCK1_CHABU|nr:hypothetical protein CBR_g803 [Chara braunii]|eukprot:GBG67673.1 hypothetical protein CBR_g803 [Chara braunii]